MPVIKARTVLFDYGNTLEMDPFDEIINKFYDRAGFASGILSVLDNWKKSNKELNWKYASHFSQEEPFIQAALKRAGYTADVSATLAPELLLEYRKNLEIHRAGDPRREVIRKVFEGLKAKGLTIGIVSNDREWAPEACMRAYGVHKLLDRIYTSEELGVEKPDPEVFRKVCADMNIEPRELCYVGDDPVRDIQCPKQLGISAVLYVPPGKYKQSESWRDYNAKISESPDAVIENLEELLDIIEPIPTPAS